MKIRPPKQRDLESLQLCQRANPMSGQELLVSLMNNDVSCLVVEDDLRQIQGFVIIKESDGNKVEISQLGFRDQASLENIIRHTIRTLDRQKFTSFSHCIPETYQELHRVWAAQGASSRLVPKAFPDEDGIEFFINRLTTSA